MTVHGPRDLTPDPNDQLTGQDVNDAWSLEPGETKTFFATCGPRTFVTDGHVLVQSVDQGTGEPRCRGAPRAKRGHNGYEFRLRNTARGRAQGPLRTLLRQPEHFQGARHRHHLGIRRLIRFSGETTTPTKSATLMCDRQGPRRAELHGVPRRAAPLMQSEPTPDGRGGGSRASRWRADLARYRCLTYADLGEVLLQRVPHERDADVRRWRPPRGATPRWTAASGSSGSSAASRPRPICRRWGRRPRRGAGSTGCRTSAMNRSATFSLLCIGLVTNTTSRRSIARHLRAAHAHALPRRCRCRPRAAAHRWPRARCEAVVLDRSRRPFGVRRVPRARARSR